MKKRGRRPYKYPLVTPGVFFINPPPLDILKKTAWVLLNTWQYSVTYDSSSNNTRDIPPIIIFPSFFLFSNPSYLCIFSSRADRYRYRKIRPIYLTMYYYTVRFFLNGPINYKTWLWPPQACTSGGVLRRAQRPPRALIMIMTRWEARALCRRLNRQAWDKCGSVRRRDYCKTKKSVNKEKR